MYYGVINIKDDNLPKWIVIKNIRQYSLTPTDIFRIKKNLLLKVITCKCYHQKQKKTNISIFSILLICYNANVLAEFRAMHLTLYSTLAKRVGDRLKLIKRKWNI